MGRLDSATFGWLTVVLSTGCTQALDFDSVSKAGGGGQGFSCAEQGAGATFCDDFEGAPPKERWSQLLVSPQGIGTIDSDANDALSPSHAMLVSYVGGAAGGGYTAVAALRQFADFTDAPISVVVTFDMKVEQVDPRYGARVAAFQFLFGAADAYNQLVLNLESRETEVSAQFTENMADTRLMPAAYDTNAGGFQDAPNLGKWSSVRLELEVFQPKGTNNSAKMFVDGAKFFDGALKFGLYGGMPRLEMGLPYVDVTNATSPWRIRFDNVLVNVQRK